MIRFESMPRSIASFVCGGRRLTALRRRASDPVLVRFIVRMVGEVNGRSANRDPGGKRILQP